MSKDIVIDGMLSGTGVRDAANGGYIPVDAVGLSYSLAADLADWQRRYEEAHFAGFPDSLVGSLDEEGLALVSRVQAEFPDRRVGYLSSGKMKRLV